MSIYAILSKNFLISFISFNIAVLMGVKGGINYFCDGTDVGLF